MSIESICSSNCSTSQCTPSSSSFTHTNFCEAWHISIPKELCIETLSHTIFWLTQRAIFLRYVILDRPRKLTRRRQALLILLLDTIEHRSWSLATWSTINRLIFGQRGAWLLSYFSANRSLKELMHIPRSLKSSKKWAHLRKKKSQLWTPTTRISSCHAS